MMNKFKKGQEVSGIFWPDNSQVVAGKNKIDKITVVIEAEIPWFAVWSDGKVIAKHNANFISSVKL